MTPSEKNLSAIVLLIVIMATVCPLCSMVLGCESIECRHQSSNYRGLCFGFTDGCYHTCLAESSDNQWGQCDCLKCYCYTC
ncbi:hypothetical protein CFC21_099985 [Triticum aestivum]|uniref:Knottin scorpion toxin-like domain-containing protein n=2 Tax=Triticum aestivum TaxID=4565 RepID=A0A9R1N2G8_WHEAT|nr:hypothetical protein CFC21_099985 [Triticum aestivum]